MTKKIDAWHKQAITTLIKTREHPALEVQALLAHATGQPRAWVIAHPEVHLEEEQISWLDQAVERLHVGEPLPYLIGRQEFFGLDFLVTPQVLIPRPETELLVETALGWLSSHPQQRSAADVGTGSGCIAISLAKHCPNLQLAATDISRAALDLAVQNAVLHLTRQAIHFIQADLLTPVRSRIDLCCANLPYIPGAACSHLDVSRYEPHLALDGGADGLLYIQRLLQDAPRWLAPGGAMLLEIEAGQGESAPILARRAFSHADIHVMCDLASHPRLLVVQT